MTYKDFIKYVAKKQDISFDEAKDWIEVVVGEIREVILTGENIKFPYFGTFFPRRTKSRNKYDPITKTHVVTKPIFKLDVIPSREFSQILTLQLTKDLPNEFKEAYQERQAIANKFSCEEDFSGLEEEFPNSL
jgi:nucleoid DNA-binding protein